MRRRAQHAPQSETGWSAPLAAFSKNSPIVHYVARALVAGQPRVDETEARLAETLGRDWVWIPALASRYGAAFAGSTRPRLRDVIAFLVEDKIKRFAAHVAAIAMEEGMQVNFRKTRVMRKGVRPAACRAGGEWTRERAA